MKLYKDFYESFVPSAEGFAKIPQLVFVCEDDKNMAETFKELITNNVEIKGIKFYFTTDLKQNADSLDKSFMEFKLDEETQKYKVEEVAIKLLEK